MVHNLRNLFNEMLGFKCPPLKVVQRSTHGHVLVDVNALKFLRYVVKHVHCSNPSVFDVIKPFLVIAIIRIMKIEYVFKDEDKALDAFIDQGVNDIGFQYHDVVFNGIVPFANALNYGCILKVIDIQHFEV